MEYNGRFNGYPPKCVLDGVNELCVIRRGNEKHYKLRLVDEEELFSLRTSGKPGFVLKRDGKLYYAEIDPNININLDIDGQIDHKCGMCTRCSALSDEKGGCAKVRDHSAEDYTRHSSNRVLIELSKEKADLVTKIWTIAKRIEKYPFVVAGYETFNMNVGDSVLNISLCKNFMGFDRRPKTNSQDAMKLKKSIAEFYELFIAEA